jgi:peptidoglycan/LPS O-acetylase OafA/YrhL
MSNPNPSSSPNTNTAPGRNQITKNSQPDFFLQPPSQKMPKTPDGKQRTYSHDLQKQRTYKNENPENTPKFPRFSLISPRFIPKLPSFHSLFPPLHRSSDPQTDNRYPNLIPIKQHPPQAGFLHQPHRGRREAELRYGCGPAPFIPSHVFMETLVMKRIPSLDGLRAISIFLVLALHTLQEINNTHHIDSFWFTFANGEMGVYIFFVLSGFLITTLLLREHDKSRSISLRDFYVRRAFRILPPIYFYIAVLVALSWKWNISISPANIRSALFFYSNYANANITGSNWALLHFWSLSVEEQFYFLWPITLLLALRRSRRTAAWCALAAVIACPIIRVATYEFGNAYMRIANGEAFQSRADALMFGCLIALLWGTPMFERTYAYAARVAWIFPVLLFLVSGSLQTRLGNYWDFPIGFTLDGICISFILIWCIRNPSTTVGRFLNSRVMTRIGVLSYSIYIWQELFLHPDNVAIFGAHTLAHTFPVRYLMLAAISSFSYWIVERPSLRLRDTLQRKLDLSAAPRPVAAEFSNRSSLHEP